MVKKDIHNCHLPHRIAFYYYFQERGGMGIMSLLQYKRLKGFFISLAFIVSGVSLLLDPKELTAQHISAAFPLVWFALFFILCGLISFHNVWRNHPANMFWYAPYYAFWVSDLLVWTENRNQPIISIVLFTLLGVLLTVDVIQDMRGEYE